MARSRVSDDGSSRCDAAEEIRFADVIDWSRGVRYRHSDDYSMAVGGYDTAVRVAVFDCAHLLDLQLLLSNGTV